jgi:hypothetical protein
MNKFALPGLLSSAVQRIKTQSILAPLLALNVICGAMGVATVWRVGDSPLGWGFCVIFGASILFTMIAFTFWSFKDADRLQTEDFRLACQQMTLIGDERSPNSPELLEGKLVAKKTTKTAERRN